MAHFITHWLAEKRWNEQSYNFHQNTNSVNADRAQYVRSSSGLITIAVTVDLIVDLTLLLVGVVHAEFDPNDP